MINITAKNTLAKLLAKEGITVQHGSFETAFFDVKSRVLGLPLWKDMDNLYDLLVGHEVGHALFTPADGWDDAIDGLPKTFVNIIEDIRIEKLIQRKYPGLAISFKKGYTEMNSRDFFQLGQIQMVDNGNFRLIDRINIKAKLRGLVKVTFTKAEEALVNEAFAVETWEDVLEVCKKLVENAEQEPQPEDPPMIDAMMMPMAVAGGESEEQNEGEDETDSQEDQGNPMESQANSDGSSETSEGENSESTDQASSDENGQSDSKSEETKGASSGTGEEEKDDVEGTREVPVLGGKEGGDHFESKTQDAVDNAKSELVEKDENGLPAGVIYGMTADQWNDCIITHKEIATERLENSGFFGPWAKEEEQAFGDFEIQTKRFVQVMAKEFEMKKAAWRSKRAQTARSGTLDVNKLYSYKYNDDIFKKITHLPNAKDHGLYMLVDWSGSMWSCLGSVIKQVLNLTAFCKKVNIPFEVISFTTTRNENKMSAPSSDHVDHGEVKLIEMLSSRMSKVEYQTAVRAFHKMAWCLTNKGGYGSREVFTKSEDLGGTPLDAVLTYLPKALNKFRSENNIQKVMFMALTDGCSSQLQSQNSSYSRRVKHVIINNRLVNDNTTEGLLKNLKNYCDNTVGYFLSNASSWEFSYAARQMLEKPSYSEEQALRKKFLKDKFLHAKNTAGYGDYFVLRNDKKSLDTNNEGFTVSAVAKKGEIARAFKKFNKQKKANRVLATKFAEAVA